jgi:hypothetical protein
MKKQLGMKIYLWLSGAVLPIWLINYFIGQHHGAEIRPAQSQISAEQTPDVQSIADHQPAMALKLSFTLSQNMAKNIRMYPVAKHHEATALNMSFFLSQANAVEIGAIQTPATMEKKERARQSKERLNEIALNIDQLSRQKVALPESDPFVAKLPPSPSPKIATTPPPPPVPMAPPFPYTFMGRMVENDTTTLFLTKQDQSYSVKLNGVLENNYRVDKIDNDQVIFTYLPLNTQQVMYIGHAG